MGRIDRGTSRSTNAKVLGYVSAGQRVRRQGLEPRTRGLRVDCCGAPPALPAPTSQGSARNARNARGCDWCSFHEPFHDAHDMLGNIAITERSQARARAESNEEARGSWLWARCRRTPTRRSPGNHQRGQSEELRLAWVMFGQSWNGVARRGAKELGEHLSPVSSPSRRAGGDVSACLFFCGRDHRHGRAPWPGPHLGPVGRAGGPHARGTRARLSAGGYGSAACFSPPPVSHPSRGGRWRAARSCWPGSSGNGTNSGRRRASPEGACRVGCRCAAFSRPQVLPGPAG